MADGKNKSQREKFEDAARELETDDSEEAFKRVVKKIASTPLPKRNSNGGKPAKKNNVDRQR